jgi:hypothetical protein
VKLRIAKPTTSLIACMIAVAAIPAAAEAARPATTQEKVALRETVRDQGNYFKSAVVVDVTVSTAGPFALGYARSERGTPRVKQIQPAWIVFHKSATGWKYWADVLHQACKLPTAVLADLDIAKRIDEDPSSVCRMSNP